MASADAFLADALERRAVLFAIHEAADRSVALSPVSGYGVVGLRAIPHSAIAMIVTDGSVLSHICHILSALTGAEPVEQRHHTPQNAEGRYKQDAMRIV